MTEKTHNLKTSYNVTLCGKLIIHVTGKICFVL